MTDYNAGKAKAYLELDDSKFQATYSKVIKQVNDFTNLKPPTNASGGFDKQALAIQKVGTEAAKAKLVAQQLATETNRTTKSALDASIAEQKHAQSISNTAKAAAQSQAAQIRLQQTQARAARANQNGGLGPTLPRSLEFFGTGAIDQIKSSFLGLVGPAAIVTGAIQGIGKAVQSTQEALALRETKNALFAVAGDMKTYNTVLDEAKKQQLIFGGTLKDNIEGITGLSIAAKSSGANLGQLINLQQRLALKDTAQGAQGALIALNEALSGNALSLSRRFEIPKDQLQGLADTTKPIGDRLAVIDTYLNKIGITSDSITSRVDQDALVFRTLNAELETLTLNTGNKLASNLSGIAEGLSRIIGLVNENPEAIAKLGALRIFGGSGTITKQDIEKQRAIIAQTNAVDTLAGPDNLSGSTSVLGIAANQNRLGNQKQQAQDLLTILNLAGERSAEAGRQATLAFQTSDQSASDYILTLQKLVVQSQSVAQKTADSKDALNEELSAKIKSKIHTDDLADLQRQLAADSLLAAQGLLGAGDQAVLLAQKYPLAVAEAQKLIDAQAFLAGQGSKSTRLTARGSLPEDTAKQGLLFLAEGRQITSEEIEQGQANFDRQKEKERQEAERRANEAERLRSAEIQFRLSGAKTSAERVAILKGELVTTTDQVERLRIQTDINRELNSEAKSHNSELNKQLTLQEGIYDSLNKQKHAVLDIQELSIKDRQKTREEDRAIAKAQRVLNNPKFAKNAAAAQDALALIDVERQQRALDISDKIATAGGSIINGKLRQSVQSGTVPTVNIPSIVPTAGASASQRANQAFTPSSAASVATLRLTDQAGRVIADLVGPILAQDQLVTFQAVTSGGQGKGP